TVPLELARAAGGDDRARTLAQLGRTLFGSQSPDDREEAQRVFMEAIVASPAESVLRAQLQTELEQLEKRISQTMRKRLSIPAEEEIAPPSSRRTPTSQRDP